MTEDNLLEDSMEDSESVPRVSKPTLRLSKGAMPMVLVWNIKYNEEGTMSEWMYEVLSPQVVRVNQPLACFGTDTMGYDTVSLSAQEGLQEIEVDADDGLRITDVFISQEKDSAYALVECEDSPGRRIVKGRLLEVGSLIQQFVTPHICQRQCTLKYFGHDTGLNVCIIHGQLT